MFVVRRGSADGDRLGLLLRDVPARLCVRRRRLDFLRCFCLPHMPGPVQRRFICLSQPLEPLRLRLLVDLLQFDRIGAPDRTLVGIRAQPEFEQEAWDFGHGVVAPQLSRPDGCRVRSAATAPGIGGALGR
ncbi:hypothetical protein D3C86_1694460 [compost metagenome]